MPDLHFYTGELAIKPTGGFPTLNSPIQGRRRRGRSGNRQLDRILSVSIVIVSAWEILGLVGVFAPR